MPLGIKVTPGIFQQVKDKLLNNVGFAIAYPDDILRVKAKNNILSMSEVFEKIKQYGFKLSLDKCEFFSSQIKYLEQMQKTH